MNKRHLNLNPTDRILEIFNDKYQFAYVALHPFYKKVFSDKYDYESDLQLAYPLLQPVHWETVALEMGLKRTTYLAAGINQTDEKLYREINDFLDYKNLEFPDERFPYSILIPTLKFLNQQNINKINGQTLQTIWEDEQNVLTFDIQKEELYNISIELTGCDFIDIPQEGIAVFLPRLGLDECYYSLLFAKEKGCLDFVKQLPGDGFWADKNTNVQWW